jgi:hypothetical protein
MDGKDGLCRELVTFMTRDRYIVQRRALFQKLQHPSNFSERGGT